MPRLLLMALACVVPLTACIARQSYDAETPDPPVCGDGLVAGTEECDDDNAFAGDGCTADCRIEAGWECVDSPSRCAPLGFIRVPAGTFTMGSPEGELGRDTDELQHEVVLTGAFLLSRTEITQREVEAVLGFNPSHFGPNGAGPNCGPDCPVERVTWHDAVAYANALSEAEGLEPCYDIPGGATLSCQQGGNASDWHECYPDRGGIYTASVALNDLSSPYDCEGYRLPTEAEWEWAARAGTAGATYNGELTETICEQPHPTLDAIAWFCGTAGGGTHEKATRTPNLWGLHDMLGNVCSLCFVAAYRVDKSRESPGDAIG